VWDVVERKDGECPSITFQYDSKDGEEGNVTNIFVSTAKLFHTFQDTLAMLPLEQRILFLRPPL
jgi:hypothetical protein